MNLEDYAILYDQPEGTYDNTGYKNIRTVTIRAGRSLEVYCYPNVKRWPEGARRARKQRKSRQCQVELNARNVELHIMRLFEMNFTPSAVVLTGTYEYPGEDYGLTSREALLDFYEAHHLPESMADARNAVTNYLRRLKRRMEKAGHAPKECKWLYVIEEGAKEEPFGLPPRYHFHCVLEAPGLSRDEIEDLWPFGFTRCERLDMKHDGARRLAHYFCKQKRGGRSWAHSRNLKKPTRSVSERKVSRARAARVAEDVQSDGRAIFEKLYPGYAMMQDVRVSYSDYLPGAFIYARMRRRD